MHDCAVVLADNICPEDEGLILSVWSLSGSAAVRNSFAPRLRLYVYAQFTCEEATLRYEEGDS